MLAVVILASALLLLTNSWNSAFLRVRKTQNQFEVAALLERKMTEIEIQYRGKPISEIREEDSGDFGSEYPQYGWRMESQNLELPDMGAILSAGEGQDEMMAGILKQVFEGLAKAIKEVTVIVIRKDAKPNPLEYSVTTYFIEYDKDVQIGMPGG